MRYLIYQWFWIALDWLFPPICGGCEALGSRWCSDCDARVDRILPPYCEICGQNSTAGSICARCKSEPPKYDAMRSWAIFGGPIRNVLHGLKYRRNVAFGDALTKALSEVYARQGWKVDLVVPVPLGRARRKERGYNQAAMLARPLALMFSLPYRPGALSRVRETRSQVDLTRAERRKNVAGAFRARKKLVAGRNVLVVDDVTTSGSTIDACAEALLSAGAKRVYGLTLARARLGSAKV